MYVGKNGLKVRIIVACCCLIPADKTSATYH